MKNYKETIRKEIERSQDFEASDTAETFKQVLVVRANGEIYIDGQIARITGKINLGEFIEPEDFDEYNDGLGVYGSVPKKPCEVVRLEVKKRHELLFVEAVAYYEFGGCCRLWYTTRKYKTPWQLRKLYWEYDLPVYEEEA